MSNILQTSLLYQELARRSTLDSIANELKARLDLALTELSTVLSEIRRYFAHFTDHSITHSVRIIERYQWILEKSQYTSRQTDESLTSVDIYMLISSALIHDIGMVVSDSEIDQLITEPNFQSILSNWVANHKDELNNDWYRKGIPRLCVAEYVRKYHPSRALSIILEGKLASALTRNSHDLAHWLGSIAEAHGLDFTTVADSSRFPLRTSVALGSGLQQDCSPRFAALCLRLGDLLDISTARACPLLRGFSEPLTFLSEKHWDQYKNIRLNFDHQRRQLILEGTCPNQDSERILREWCSWLDNELVRATSLQSTEDSQYRIKLGQFHYDVKAELGSDGQPRYEFLNLKFNLDERLVFERLFGKALYGRPELALREVLQNAVDAQRAKLLNELAQSSDWRNKSEDEKRKTFQSSLKKKTDQAIEIILTSSQKAIGPERWLTVRDSGIGMSRNVIEHYFLKVGRSRWGEDPAIGKFGLGSFSIGTFGIGVLATLLIADRVVVTTHSCLPDERPIKITIYGWQGFLSTEYVKDAPVGTSVSLRLIDDRISDGLLLCQILERLTPNLDFGLEVKWDSRVERIKKITDKENKNSILSFDEDGSILILSQLRIRPTGFCCQDGIHINEMGPPSEVSPTSYTLRLHLAAIDLRGTSRVPLNLARTLPEEGQETFWASYVPKLWNCIFSLFPKDQCVRATVADLIESEFAQLSTSKYRAPLRFLIRPDKATIGVDSLERFSCLHCLDTANRDIEELRAIKNNQDCCWLMPPPDMFYDKVEYAGFSISTNIELSMDERKLLEDSDQYEYQPESNLHEVKKKLFTICLNKAWNALTSEFRFLAHGYLRYGMLSRDDRHPSLSSILGFSPCNQWISLLDPASGTHELIPSFLIEGLEDVAQELSMGIADYYLCLMRILFRDTPASDWGNFRGGLSDNLLKVGLRFAAQGSREHLAHLAELEKDNYPAGGKGIEAEVEEEEEFDDESIDSHDRNEEYATFDELLSEDFRLFAPHCIGAAAKAGLERAIPEWEADRWSKLVARIATPVRRKLS